MRDKALSALGRGRDTFKGFTTGQKAVAVIGTAALLIAAVLVFRWASTPSYAPLYTDLSGPDASAVIEELDAQGIPYEIAGGGGTIMIPRGDVYSTRIALSGQGLPASSDNVGYGQLDDNGLNTSEFQEQTDFKRAMEGELATTIEAIDGVDTAVVHLAMPEKEVFSDEQAPTTASVLVDTAAGTTLDGDQVQSIVHLVSSSIEGLDPKNVTITDSAGQLLSEAGAEDGAAAGGDRAEQVQDFQQRMRQEIQTALDTVLGPGNSTVTYTADLDFDKAVTETTDFRANEDTPPLSEQNSSETYNGPGAAGAADGIVGPDGQEDPAAVDSANSSYQRTEETADNAVDRIVERRESAPGAVNTQHIGIMLDATAAAAIDEGVIRDLVRGAVGIDGRRGDTLEVTKLPFDRSAETAAAEELAAAAKAEADAAKKRMWRNVGIGAGIVLLVLLAWLQARRRAAAREEATTYIVEQLRADAAAKQAIEAPAPAVAALEAAEETREDQIRDELIALVDKQPDDVAALLRGWLVDPR